MYADVVSRGGRLLLNVGPDASGTIPAVQRRTLEAVGAFMAAVKPLTTRRQPLADGAVTVRGADWWRAWSHEDQIVVIADREDVHAQSAHGRPVTVLALPPE